jgi:phosphoglycolate phosphatase-like HAD superfamily hydrolase
VIDLDQTLVDSRVAKPLRSTRQWGDVYDLIPRFKVLPGAATLLSSTMGLKVAVVTNSPSAYAERVLGHFKLRADAIVGFHDTTLKKPHPDPVRLALKRLGIEAADVWAAGDHSDDIAAATAAGVEITIGVAMASDDVKGLRNATPSVIVPDLTAVAEWIRCLAP